MSPVVRQRRSTFSTQPKLTWNKSASSTWVLSPVNQASTSLRRRSLEYCMLSSAFLRSILCPYTKLKSALKRRPVTAGGVFDLQIVATMRANNIQRIYTFKSEFEKGDILPWQVEFFSHLLRY